MKKKLLAILLAALMIVSLLPTMAFATEAGTITELNTLLTGATSGATIKLEKDYKWTAGSETFSDSYIRISNKTFTLDLNGYTIDFAGSNKNFLLLGENCNITICDDSDAQSGAIKNGKTCIYSNYSSASLTLKGGTITGFSGGGAAINFEDGDIIMTGGKICGNETDGPAVLGGVGSTVVLCGGEISGNNAANSSFYGVGGFAGKSGQDYPTVYLGGSIRIINNTAGEASRHGANVFVYYANYHLGDGQTQVLGMTVPAPTDEMCVGVYGGTPMYGGYDFLTGVTEDAMQYFFADHESNALQFSTNKIVLKEGTSYTTGTMPTYEHGSIFVKPRVSAGETVKVTATPAAGYRLAKLTVTIGTETKDITETKSFTWPEGGKTVTLAAEFADKTSGSAQIEVEVPELNPEYTIHIPANTTLIYKDTTKQALTGSVYITDVKDFKEDQLVVCTVSGTNLKNGDKELTTTYFYGDVGKEIEVGEGTDTFDCGTGESNGTAIYAQVADWSGAASGKYTATVSFQFALAEPQ